jgi:hypothetical protein
VEVAVEEPLGDVAAALAAALQTDGETIALPVEAAEAAIGALRLNPDEEALVDIAALRARIERLAGVHGREACERLDAVLDAGLTSVDEQTSHFERATDDAAVQRAEARVAVGGGEAVNAAPAKDPSQVERPAPRPRRGLRRGADHAGAEVTSTTETTAERAQPHSDGVDNGGTTADERSTS